ncbi:hypothetical protein LAZ67_5002457 [Cordylochernes scorpioides]|uniref:HTH CENPB-type domain-containing protein n=1 Tax=Cordylochernes scorpioides TaxID=51811 RepID=A0ABY6KGC6_9ARAC|nr:hypothetical protein LAZ67_5002457 [Cordylochernes scorpioides]
MKKSTKFDEVNDIVWKFFTDMKARNIYVSGPMLQEQAIKFAAGLKLPKFSASNGWLESFRSRGQNSKERVSIVLLTNVLEDKEKPIVIRKARNPRCFKNLKSHNLPVTYDIKDFDTKMGIAKRKVLLFLDNAHTHVKINKKLDNVIFFTSCQLYWTCTTPRPRNHSGIQFEI